MRKKEWMPVLIIALVTGGLIACSKKDKPAAEPDEPENPGPVPVVYEAVPGWTKLQPNVEKIHTVFFLNDSTGYSSTTDAGASWWAPRQAGIYAWHLEVPADNAGYILQAYGVQKFETTGITQMMKTPDQLMDLHFTDMDHGWAVSPLSGGVLYRYVKP